MVLSLPIDSGGWGVTPNHLFRDAAFYVVTARWLAWAGTLPPEHHHYWLPQQTLDDHDTWTLSHLVHLKALQTHAVSEFGCPLADDNMTVPAHAPPSACAPHTSSDDVSRNGLNNGLDSRQNVRIPTQRAMTALWSHHWQRSMSTRWNGWKDIPQNMKSEFGEPE